MMYYITLIHIIYIFFFLLHPSSYVELTLPLFNYYLTRYHLTVENTIPFATCNIYFMHASIIIAFKVAAYVLLPVYFSLVSYNS